MTRSHSRRHALSAIALAVTASSVFLQGCDSAPSTIKIGVAQVKGKLVTLEVVAMDEKADVETGKEVVRKLVDAGVVAVIGDLNSGVSIAAAPIYA